VYNVRKRKEEVVVSKEKGEYRSTLKVKVVVAKVKQE
jgi:hypothetical protein